MEEKTKRFLLRSLFGLIWAGVFLLGAWYGSTWRWVILLALCIIGGVYELRSLTRLKGRALEPFLSGLGAFAILVGTWFRGTEGMAYGVLAAVLANMFTVLRRSSEGSLEILSRSVFTSFYLGLGTGAALLIGRAAHGGSLLVVILGALWLADTGAYIVGSLLGRHPLAPTLSPKKTVEGLVAGVVLAGVGAWFLESYYFDADLPGKFTPILGGVVALAALLGDLAVSAIKRDVGVKDSGSLIPGHGGLMDRLDGFLVAMPAAYLFLVSIRHAGLWDGNLG